MTCRRILAGLDDSPAGLAGARYAVELAVSLGARVRFVHVTGDGEVVRGLTALHRDHGIDVRRRHEAQALLSHMLGEARKAGADAEGETLEGEPAPLLLEAARSWDADLVVLGHSGKAAPGRPSLGGLTRHLLEFSECPVLVVPQRSRSAREPAIGRFGDPRAR